eukprot:gene9043-16687_t
MSCFGPTISLQLRRISSNICKRVYTSEVQQKGVSSSKGDRAPPSPPPPGLCCMSGCQNCVWLEYAEDLSEFFKDGGKKAEEALDDIPDANLKAFLKMELRMKK